MKIRTNPNIFKKSAHTQINPHGWQSCNTHKAFSKRKKNSLDMSGLEGWWVPFHSPQRSFASKKTLMKFIFSGLLISLSLSPQTVFTFSYLKYIYH